MSVDESLEKLLRKVFREELQALLSDKPEELLTAEDVRQRLNLKSIQKVYSLVREKEIDAIWISKREFRIAPSALRAFQLKRGIKAA